MQSDRKFAGIDPRLPGRAREDFLEDLILLVVGGCFLAWGVLELRDEIFVALGVRFEVFELRRRVGAKYNFMKVSRIVLT